MAWLDHAIHVFAVGSKKRRGWPAFAGHDGGTSFAGHDGGTSFAGHDGGDLALVNFKGGWYEVSSSAAFIRTFRYVSSSSETVMFFIVPR
ncbi:MAG TPA: hypothetical protein VHX12_05445 [Acidisoma sp.]|nr:hypothetical protein [Acidisoma sp.]